MALFEIAVVISLLAILYTLREILHFTKLTVFKLAHPEPVKPVKQGPKARKLLQFS